MSGKCAGAEVVAGCGWQDPTRKGSLTEELGPQVPGVRGAEPGAHRRTQEAGCVRRRAEPSSCCRLAAE